MHPALRYGGQAGRPALLPFAADKLVMENLAALVNPRAEQRDPSLPADLLQALQRMVRGGHLPSSLLLVQLTDGRVRLDASPRSLVEARDRLGRMSNEYGPVRAAFWISVQRDGPAVRLAVETLGSPPRQVETSVSVDHTFGAEPNGPQSAYALVTGDGSAGCTIDFSASSKKRAMLEASLGITTG
jgi:hypothetical protein